MTDKEYKIVIDAFINDRYKYLLGVARNILSTKKQNHYDLLSELTLYLYTRQDKLEYYIENGALESFSVKWMKNQTLFDNTPFNKKFKNSTEDLFSYESKDDETNYRKGDYLSVNEDLEPDELIDLRKDFTDRQIDLIQKSVEYVINDLSELERIVFIEFYLNRLTYDKILDKYKFNKGEKLTRRILKELKNSVLEKIRNGIDDNF
jgi:hypothetical protein